MPLAEPAEIPGFRISHIGFLDDKRSHDADDTLRGPPGRMDESVTEAEPQFP